nr:hypothetical protein [Tanacetum cinerariifolium]
PEEETHFIKRLLYDNLSPHPPEEFISENSDTEIESFSQSPILVEDSDSLMEEIDLSFAPDYPMPPAIEDDDYDSERDILNFEELLSNDSLLLPENESFHFDIPSFSRPPAKPPDGTLLSWMFLFSISIPHDQFDIPENVKTLAKGFCTQVFISLASIGNHAHEICDVYLTEKELHQLHLDEEALRETLEEEAREEKERKEEIRQKQADDEEFMLEFRMKYD